MRILFTSDYLDPRNIGGAGRVVIEVARVLADAGHEIHVVTGGPEDAGYERMLFEDAGFPVHWTSFPYPGRSGSGPLTLLKTAMRARQVRGMLAAPFDRVVHNQPMTGALFGGLVAADGEEIRLFHSPWKDEYEVALDGRTPSFRHQVLGHLRAKIESFAVERADRIITLSEFMKSRCIDTHAVPASTIDVRPGGVDRERFTPPCDTERERLRAKYGFDDDTCGIVCVRRLVHRTGVDLLVDAANELADSKRPWRLLIAGRGAEEGKIREKAKNSKVADRIEFLGYVPDEELPDLYRAADITAMPTRALEGFGLATLESLACGTPVVATPVGGNVEILGLLDARLLTPGVTPSAIAETLTEFVNDPAELEALRPRSLAHARTFDWRGIASSILGEALPQPADSVELQDDVVSSP